MVKKMSYAMAEVIYDLHSLHCDYFAITDANVYWPNPDNQDIAKRRMFCRLLSTTWVSRTFYEDAEGNPQYQLSRDALLAARATLGEEYEAAWLG